MHLPSLLLLAASSGAPLISCNDPVPPCEPSAWRTEVWVSDQRTGLVEASLRDGCGSFPDQEVEYRITGKRPGGRVQVLFEGAIEHWERRHGVTTRADDTREIAVWDRSCVPDRDHFACTTTDWARWER